MGFDATVDMFGSPAKHPQEFTKPGTDNICAVSTLSSQNVSQQIVDKTINNAAAIDNVLGNSHAHLGRPPPPPPPQLLSRATQLITDQLCFCARTDPPDLILHVTTGLCETHRRFCDTLGKV